MYLKILKAVFAWLSSQGCNSDLNMETMYSARTKIQFEYGNCSYFQLLKMEQNGALIYKHKATNWVATLKQKDGNLSSTRHSQ